MAYMQNIGPYYARTVEGVTGWLKNIGPDTSDLLGSGAPYWEQADPILYAAVVDDNVVIDTPEYGNAPTYQWYKDKVLQVGKTTRILTLNPVAIIDGGVWQCIATNGLGSAISVRVTIHVRSAIPASVWNRTVGPVAGSTFLQNIGPQPPVLQQPVEAAGTASIVLSAGTIKPSKIISSNVNGTIGLLPGTVHPSMNYSAGAHGLIQITGQSYASNLLPGSASGNIAVSGTAHGVFTLAGAASGNITVSGSALADKSKIGHASGNINVSGIMHGTNHKSASGSMTIQLLPGVMGGGDVQNQSGESHGTVTLRSNGIYPSRNISAKVTAHTSMFTLTPKTIAGMLPLPKEVHLDGDYHSPVQHLDDEYQRTLDVEASLEAAKADYYNSPFTDDKELEIRVEFELDVVEGLGLDLLRLIPEKFKVLPAQVILVDYVHECEFQVANWLSKVKNLIKLLNPRTVNSVEYIRQLGALIGVEFSPEDESSPEEMRRTLIQATEWYRKKGTYEAIHIIALIQQFNITIFDLYTNDYTTFIPVEWWTGPENTNPPGLDSSYYKSPHFGVEVALNKVYESGVVGSSGYLWEPSYMDNFHDAMEQNRPVHTVPHYTLRMNPVADIYGGSYTNPGEIVTRTFEDWNVDTLNFDDAKNFDEVSVGSSNHRFDSEAVAFFNSITKWTLGNGTGETFVMQSPQHTGSVESIDITSEIVTYTILIPKAIVLDEITEVALYIPGSPDVMTVSSYFPSLSKDDRTELRIVVEIHRNSLS